MKSKFSTSWISSKQPRKQRKYLANAPLHLKHRLLAANLSKSLRASFGRRSLPVRKGDEVLVLRGSFKSKRGKVILVDLKRTRVTVEGIQRTKKDGTKVNVYIHPSSLQIQEVNASDKERANIATLKNQAKTAGEKNVPNKS